MNIIKHDFCRAFTILWIGFFCLPTLPAKGEKPSDKTSSVEADWQSLRAKELPSAALRQSMAGPRSAEKRIKDDSDLKAHFLSVADDAAAFSRKNPKSVRVSDAKILEAKNLLKAAFLGEKSRDTRTLALVNEIEKDKSLPVKQRFEIVAMSEHLLLRQVAKSSEQARLVHEVSARYLMKEFPSEMGGYAALLGTAQSTNDTKKVKETARDILGSPAPFAAKAQARVLAGRYELVGKSLADVANTALGRGNFFETYRDKSVVLYTWATWSPRSIAYAKQVVADAPQGTLIIGYNLDTNLSDAQKAAKKENLPGTHYYNEGGMGSLLALLLKLNSAPLAYVTDEGGVIRDVAVEHSDLAAKLSTLKGK